MLSNLMRLVRIRGLVEGVMQRGRVEGLPNDARDGALRPQDYGFAANAVDGEGIKLEIGGHTIIVRMDRTAERPRLDAYEVAVWHKEGHMVRLRAGKVVQVDCDVYRVNAAVRYEVNSPVAAFSANGTFGGTVVATGDVVGAGKSVSTHIHGTSGPPS